jgi:hypothetical protein
MQPRFPADHHFHDRRRRPAPRGDDEFAALTERAVTYLRRQCLPAFDASDPRGRRSG